MAEDDDTKRFETERKLLQSERSLDLLINSSPEPIWLIDKEHRLVMANKAFSGTMKMLYGFDVQAGQQVLFLPGLTESSRQIWRELYNRAFNGEHFTIEYPAEPDFALEGNDFEITFNPVFDESGNVIGAGCFSRDVTQRKKTEDLVRKSESELALAQKLAQYGNWSFDLLSNKVTWSEELYNIFGADKKTFLETHGSFVHLVDEADRERVRQISLRAQNEGASFDIEYGITTPAGEKRYVHELGYAERNSNGKIVRLFGTAQNITSRKQAELELKASYRKLQELTAHLQSVREEERTRIAREIHDELSQHLTVIRVDVSWLKLKMKGVNKSIREKLDTLISLVDDTIKKVRRISSELRTEVIDDLGLIGALEWQAQEFEKRTGIRAVFRSDLVDFNVDRKVAINIFRVYQEALTNVTRHAHATDVEIVLEKEDAYVRLIIKDDGKGLDLSQAIKKNSFGLIGMKERAMMLRGDLTIEPNVPNGTVIILRFRS